NCQSISLKSLYLLSLSRKNMRNKLLIFIAVLLLLPFGLHSQRITRREYIETYKDWAIQNMKETGIPASITLAQGILESSSGNSKLAREDNNHFGIKCHSDWKG